MSEVGTLRTLLHESEAHRFYTGILKFMSTFDKVSDLKKSEVRVYCDNDKRWKKRWLWGWKDSKKYVAGYPSTATMH